MNELQELFSVNLLCRTYYDYSNLTESQQEFLRRVGVSSNMFTELQKQAIELMNTASILDLVKCLNYISSYVGAYLLEKETLGVWQLIQGKFFEEDLLMMKVNINNKDYVIVGSNEVLEAINTNLLLKASGIPTELPSRLELGANSELFIKCFSVLSKMGIIDKKQVVPENLISTLIDDSTTRFNNAIWYEAIQEKTVMVAGVGGIGSWLSLLVARIMPKGIIMYDNDFVDDTNMAGQLYSTDNVGLSKVDSLAGIIRKFSSFRNYFAVNQLIDSNTAASDIMFCGFDNMNARKIAFDIWRNHVYNIAENERKECLFVDGRLAAEEFQVFCLRGDNLTDIAAYEKNCLFDDSEAEATTCTYKQTTFMANMIAGIMTNLFVNFVSDTIIEGIRDVPYLITYNGSTFELKRYYDSSRVILS